MFKNAFLYLVGVALILVACSPAMSSSPDFDSRQSVPGAAPIEPAADSSVAESAFLNATGAISERIVIKNARLSIVVPAPPETMDRIGQMAEEMGGFIVSANLYQSRLPSGLEVPRASITIRVPAELLDEAIERIEAESDLPVERNIESQDVTSDYTDLQSRLRNLEAAETQLTRIMENATDTEDVLSVYNRLIEVREQIEVIQGKIQYYEQSARLSAISVEIQSEEAVQPLSIGSWQPVGVARDALQATINALQFLFKAGIWIVLFLIPVLVVMFLPVYILVRLLLRWRARQKVSARPVPPPSGG
jgi:hypothetical protein